MTIIPEALADPIPAACARLGVSRASLYRQLQIGALCAVKCGGRTLITRQAQVDWLASLPAMHAQRAA